MSPSQAKYAQWHYATYCLICACGRTTECELDHISRKFGLVSDQIALVSNMQSLTRPSIVVIWRNCYHLPNLHSGHVGRTSAAIAYIVYIGKNKLKPNSSLVHVQTQEARIIIYSVCLHRSSRPKLSFIDTKFGVPFTVKLLKRSSLFITL